MTSSAIDIISLRIHEGHRIFVQLAQLAGCADGGSIECTLEDDAHHINWRTAYVYPLNDQSEVYVGYTTLLKVKNYSFIFLQGPSPCQFRATTW